LAANTIFNLLISHKVLMVSEGLNIFRDKTHPSLAGHTLIKSKIREDTGCTVIAVRRGEQLRLNPDPDLRLAASNGLILSGTGEAEKQFITQYPEKV